MDSLFAERQSPAGLKRTRRAGWQVHTERLEAWMPAGRSRCRTRQERRGPNPSICVIPATPAKRCRSAAVPPHRPHRPDNGQAGHHRGRPRRSCCASRHAQLRGDTLPLVPGIRIGCHGFSLGSFRRRATDFRLILLYRRTIPPDVQSVPRTGLEICSALTAYACKFDHGEGSESTSIPRIPAGCPAYLPTSVARFLPPGGPPSTRR